MMPLERFRQKYRVRRRSRCWQWQGFVADNGYGQFGVGCKTVYAHRWSYEHHRGPIPGGMDVDHLCRNRGCVNPDHLEVVTRRENLRRGKTFVARNLSKLACKRGHRLEGANLRIMPSGARNCRACAQITKRARKERQAACRV